MKIVKIFKFTGTNNLHFFFVLYKIKEYGAPFNFMYSRVLY